ncbi:hypothetical protein [Chamaesiphon minutus]|uniref:hypothetical protein n=1 Tax=Chamaesiphon minutus TaxID=1173032 RepID=UPI0012FB885C|nr:hypothetical protein [Chamaesiphon minutus]
MRTIRSTTSPTRILDRADCPSFFSARRCVLLIPVFDDRDCGSLDRASHGRDFSLSKQSHANSSYFASAKQPTTESY